MLHKLLNDNTRNGDYIMTEKAKCSQLTRAFKEDGKLKTHVGGQALIEGIMMRGKYNWSVAVREPAGTIYTEEHDLISGRKKNRWLYFPLIRGCRAFVESLALGYKALSIAAAHAFVEDEEDNKGKDKAKDDNQIQKDDIVQESGSKKETSASKDFSWKRDFGNPDDMIDALGAQRTLEIKSEIPEAKEASTDMSQKNIDLSHVQNASASDLPDKISDKENLKEDVLSIDDKKPLLGTTEMAISMIMGLALGIALFIVVPAFVTNLIVGEYDQKTLLWNAVDGVLRIAIFIFYIWLIGRARDVKRMFGYHGAEHKTIHCYEHGLELTPENAMAFPRLHVRCGTAFLIMVMVIAIFVYTLIPLDMLLNALSIENGAAKLAVVILSRIFLMPIIAGLSYEISVKWAGAHPDNPIVKIILWPGMQMQYLTTREPDAGQIECAIEAMQLVLEREKREQALI